MGAFAAVFGAYTTGSTFIGALYAVISGILMALIFAEFHLRQSGDAIVISIALNLIGVGFDNLSFESCSRRKWSFSEYCYW